MGLSSIRYTNGYMEPLGTTCDPNKNKYTETLSVYFIFVTMDMLLRTPKLPENMVKYLFM